MGGSGVGVLERGRCAGAGSVCGSGVGVRERGRVHTITSGVKCLD